MPRSGGQACEANHNVLEVPVKNLFGALTAGMLVCTSLVASPVGNAAAPMSFQDGVYQAGNPDYSFRLGFSADHIADRKLKVKTASSSNDHIKTSIMAHTGDVTFSMYNRFDIYGRFGVAEYNMNKNQSTSNLSVHSERDAFIWAVGGRAVIYNWDFTTLSAFGEYSRFEADVDDVVLAEVSSGKTSAIARVSDWNIGLALSHEIDYLAPYIAIKYSDAKVDMKNKTISAPETTLEDLESRYHVGAVLGCTFMAGKKLDLSVEARLIDETAMAVVGAFRF